MGGSSALAEQRSVKQMNDSHQSASPDDGSVMMPRPTAWPLVLALGLTLALLGIVTSYIMTAPGIGLAVIGLAGWIHQLLPGVGRERMAWAPPHERPSPIAPSEIAVASLKPGMPGHRARLPEKVHPYSAGATGGLIGGVAMAATALTYGALSGRGIWYPVNLLAGMVLPSVAEHPEHLNIVGLIVATFIHGLTSLGVGMFFGVLLPTLPRWPIFWGGIVGPLLWTGAIYSFMGVLNPILAQEVDWAWFVASQFAYGLVMGIVVMRSEKVWAEKAVYGSPDRAEPRS